MIAPAFRYRASLIRVIDGDSYVATVDLGFYVSLEIRVRLRGVNCPELRTPEGKAAALFVVDLLESGGDVVIASHKDQRSFERWICDVWVDGHELAQLLIDAGHGTARA